MTKPASPSTEVCANCGHREEDHEMEHLGECVADCGPVLTCGCDKFAAPASPSTEVPVSNYTYPEAMCLRRKDGSKCHHEVCQPQPIERCSCAEALRYREALEVVLATLLGARQSVNVTAAIEAAPRALAMVHRSSSRCPAVALVGRRPDVRRWARSLDGPKRAWEPYGRHRRRPEGNALSDEQREAMDRKVSAWEARTIEIFSAGGLMEVHPEDVVLKRVDGGEGWPYFRPLLPRERQ